MDVDDDVVATAVVALLALWFLASFGGLWNNIKKNKGGGSGAEPLTTREEQTIQDVVSYFSVSSELCLILFVLSVGFVVLGVVFILCSRCRGRCCCYMLCWSHKFVVVVFIWVCRSKMQNKLRKLTITTWTKSFLSSGLSIVFKLLSLGTSASCQVSCQGTSNRMVSV